jgi:uracil-DNA glycosylase
MKQIPINIDINELRDSANDKLQDSGWAPMLTPFINGLDFDLIVEKLVSLVNAERRFTPRFKDIFNGFKECKYNDLKCIIVGQDPYPQLGVADGIAFSCSRKGKAEKSLQYINKAIGTDHTDLRCWANQGVLLINTAFTCEVNSIGSHYDLWKPFSRYIFENINRHNKNIPVILMGKKAEAWETMLNNQKIYKVKHPASAAYRGGEWECDDVFNKVNLELEKQDIACIKW